MMDYPVIDLWDGSPVATSTKLATDERGGCHWGVCRPNDGGSIRPARHSFPPSQVAVAFFPSPP
jgi:hypothetical protein